MALHLPLLLLLVPILLQLPPLRPPTAAASRRPRHQLRHHRDGGAWTERDEARRIAQIKADERRQFELAGGGRLPPPSSSQEEGHQQHHHQLSSSPISTSSRDGSSGEQEAPPPSLWSPPSPSSSRHHSSPERPRPIHGSVAAAFSDNGTAIGGEEAADGGPGPHWCFHCVSPLGVVSEEMQRVVRNLLEVRRAQYPAAEAVTADCAAPKRLDGLRRQRCHYSHCQTLVLTDHNAGSAFALRGCAEHFGAIDRRLLARREDNSCHKLHPTVDIQECICEKRRYCYTGPDRPFARRYTATEAWWGGQQPAGGGSSARATKTATVNHHHQHQHQAEPFTSSGSTDAAGQRRWAAAAAIFPPPLMSIPILLILLITTTIGTI